MLSDSGRRTTSTLSLFSYLILPRRAGSPDLKRFGLVSTREACSVPGDFRGQGAQRGPGSECLADAEEDLSARFARLWVPFHPVIHAQHHIGCPDAQPNARRFSQTGNGKIRHARVDVSRICKSDAVEKLE